MTVVAQCQAKYTNDWVRVRRLRADRFEVEFLSNVGGWREVPMLTSSTRQKAVQEMRRLAHNSCPMTSTPMIRRLGGRAARIALRKGTSECQSLNRKTKRVPASVSFPTSSSSSPASQGSVVSYHQSK